MNINKAIKKQDKSVNRFLLLMGFIFFILIISLIITKLYHTLFLAFFLLICIIILISVLITLNYYSLTFTLHGYKIVIKQGLFNERINVPGEKIIFVGIEEDRNDFNILLISYAKIRNKKAKKIDREFLIKHGYISSYYLDIIRKKNEENCCYIIINRGGLKKYTLLNSIYKACVYAEYSEEAIEKIKEYREGIK